MRLIHKGAEAELYLDVWHGLIVVRKIRVRKRYRTASLDENLRHKRTIREALIMHEAKKAGVATPLIYFVDLELDEIIMQYIEGRQLRELLDNASDEQRFKICLEFGVTVGKLHNGNIVHGDLTTSNVIVNGKNIFLVDFGLSEHSKELEKRGVDILLGQRVFQSTHHKYGKTCYSGFLDGYSSVVGQDNASQVEHRVREITRRGRYAIER